VGALANRKRERCYKDIAGEFPTHGTGYFAIGTGNYFGSRELPKLGSRKINWDGIFTLAARGVRVLAQHKMQASCMP
jgi:hypothetical protein